MKKTYSIKNIDCANCAAKIEDKINKVKKITEANLNFMMEKLTIEFDCTTDDEVNEIMKDVEKIVSKVEPDAVIS